MRQEGKRIEKEVEDRRGDGGEGYVAATKNGECLSCGEPGHQAKGCGKQQRQQRGGRERKAGTRTCYKCQRRGHIAKDCRSKKVKGAGGRGGHRGSEEQLGADIVTLPSVYNHINCLDMHLCGGPGDPMACGECGIGHVHPEAKPDREDKNSPSADEKLFAALDQTSRKIKFQIDSGASLTVIKKPKRPITFW